MSLQRSFVTNWCNLVLTKRKLLTLLLSISALLTASACGNEPPCKEISDHYFAAEAQDIEITNNESLEIRFVFYPIPGQMMRFNKKNSDNLFLSSSYKRLLRTENKKAPTENETNKRFFDRENPLVVSVSVKRNDISENITILDFGDFGTLEVPIDSTVTVSPSIYYVIPCILDSGEGLRGNDLQIEIRPDSEA